MTLSTRLRCGNNLLFISLCFIKPDSSSRSLFLILYSDILLSMSVTNSYSDARDPISTCICSISESRFLICLMISVLTLIYSSISLQSSATFVYWWFSLGSFKVSMICPFNLWTLEKVLLFFKGVVSNINIKIYASKYNNERNIDNSAPDRYASKKLNKWTLSLQIGVMRYIVVSDVQCF
jgi:hypothetical protein